MPVLSPNEVAEPKELLIELLRSELEVYGGLLALLEDQQSAIVDRKPERVLEINTLINDEMRMIQMRRETREDFVVQLADRLNRPRKSTVRELIPNFRQPIQPLLEALIDEINRLVARARRRAQQNQMLLARSIEVLQEVLRRLNPEAVSSVYGADGRMMRGVRDHRRRWVAQG